jgi:hypothetical protein
MIKNIGSLLVCTSLILSCTNLDNAKPTATKSFTYFYGGLRNYQATAAIEVSDGFLVAGDSITLADYAIVLIKTDRNGGTVWRKLIPHASVSSIQAISNGYLICGDSMKVDRNQSRIIDQIRTKMRIIVLDQSGHISHDKSFGNVATLPPDTVTRMDIHGSAITVDANQNYVVTSTVNLPYNQSNLNIYTQITSLDPSTLKVQWSNSYNQDGAYNYTNGRSVTSTLTGNIIWATSAIRGSASNPSAFLRVPVYSPTGSLVNGDNFGQDEGAYYSGSDIKSNGVGFGIIGTYQGTGGANANVFFVRANPEGTIVSSSALFFDGPTCSANQPLSDKTISVVQDQGISLAVTQDGGFLLAASTTSTADGTWGNGGQDVYLIRLDPFGNMLWNHFLGGSGDEVPSSVTQCSDGGFLICGTLTLAGQSSMFIMKTNSLGELKN